MWLRLLSNLAACLQLHDCGLQLLPAAAAAAEFCRYILDRRSLLPFLTVLFGAANSHTQARDALAPYLEMKGVPNPEEQDALVEKHKFMFYQFGWAALIFSCIPIFGTFFAFSNTVGAALWAIDLEKQQFNLMSDDRKKMS